MSGKTMGRILTAALITATLATPLPARATTAQGRAVFHPAWSWLTGLWPSAFGGALLPHRSEPAGTKQGLLIDPNGGPVPTDSCTSMGICGTGPVTDPNR
jgi:hypothetical protein